MSTNRLDERNTIRSTERSLPIALLRAREVVMEPIREMLSKSQISEQKWRVLRVVEELGPIEQSAVAKQACLLLPSLTRLIQSMEQEGLLERREDEQDRRKSLVSITDNGKELVKTHLQESKEIFEKLEKNFGSYNYYRLLDLLEELQSMKL